MDRYSWLLWVLIVAVLGSLGQYRAMAEAERPTQLVQRLIKAMGSIKAANNGHLSEAERAANAAAAQIANTILDVPGVSQWTLGKHWEARTLAEQQEFIALLEQLCAKTVYLKSAEFFGDLQMTYDEERITGPRALVRTTVRHPKEGLVAIDYRLTQHNRGWRVRDIVLDDVSLAANLRSQFHKIIAEHSYAELIRRMREKLQESDSPLSLAPHRERQGAEGNSGGTGIRK